MKLGQSAARTDPGRKRRGNEDSYVMQPPLFAIADGMGGAKAGEVASALAASALEERGARDGGREHVVELIQEANRRVHERALTDAATSGMGTTITVAIVENDGSVTFGHVGDSRAYLLRGNTLGQLTDDHSLVAELVRRGELSPQAAEVHPQRSVITRALGTDPDVDVDAFTVETKPGDIFLICSDGLSDMVDGVDIERILRAERTDLDAAARALVQAANRAGGEDNITAVLFEVVDGDPPAAEPDETTRESTVVLPHDEEDTLHPEDGVQPPPPAAYATPAVGSTEAGSSAGAGVDGAGAERQDTMVVPVAEVQAAVAEHEAATPEASEAELPQAGIGRRLLALVVILALIALIVVLVWWGLAR